MNLTAHLRTLSGLPVAMITSEWLPHYVFGDADNPIKVAFNYCEAEMFAEGVAAGRALNQCCCLPIGETNES